MEVDGELFKEYYGSASDFNKGEYKHVEGKRILEPIKGKLANTLIEMEQDVQSSISYAGGTKLMDIRKVNYVIPGRRQRRRTPADVSPACGATPAPHCRSRLRALIRRAAKFNAMWCRSWPGLARASRMLKWFKPGRIWQRGTTWVPQAS